jgi:hypothetical protein
MKLRVALATVLLLALSQSLVHACWGPLSEEERQTRATLIVLGKLSDRRAVEGNFAHATLTISERFKGDTPEKITLQFTDQLLTSKVYTFKGDEEGLWFLVPVEGSKDTFRPFHPQCFDPATRSDEAEQKKFKALIERTRTASKK